jgi:hypothetical protein
MTLTCLTGDCYERVGPLPGELRCMVGRFKLSITFHFLSLKMGLQRFSVLVMYKGKFIDSTIVDLGQIQVLFLWVISSVGS